RGGQFPASVYPSPCRSGCYALKACTEVELKNLQSPEEVAVSQRMANERSGKLLGQAGAQLVGDLVLLVGAGQDVHVQRTAQCIERDVDKAENIQVGQLSLGLNHIPPAVQRIGL